MKLISSVTHKVSKITSILHNTKLHILFIDLLIWCSLGMFYVRSSQCWEVLSSLFPKQNWRVWVGYMEILSDGSQKLHGLALSLEHCLSKTHRTSFDHLLGALKIKELHNRTYPKPPVLCWPILSWKPLVVWIFFKNPKPQVCFNLKKIQKTRTSILDLSKKKKWNPKVLLISEQEVIYITKSKNHTTLVRPLTLVTYCVYISR